MNISKRRNELRDYYSNAFDVNVLSQVIDFSSFSTREFGFTGQSGKFFRNISFETPNALQDFLIDRCPTNAYIGAVYDNPPSREQPIHTLEWKGHELVFDIDLNDYDAVRKHVCDCTGAGQVCLRCWQLINVSISLIDETLRRDFGMTEIIWLFSGRRGVHGWVRDSITFDLDRDQRQSIIDYLTVIKGEDEKARVQDRKQLKYEFRKRTELTIFKYSLNDVRRKDLVNLGLSGSAATKIVNQLKHQEGKVDDNLIRRFNKNLASVNKYDEVLRRWAPRIDHKVTIDLRRLLRMPMSIHGKTGMIAQILDLDTVFEFNPEDQPSIFSDIQIEE
ncbi:MAG: DNA primase catalytic subunit PriS [Candidatus Hodarchaeales archaeon]|jgi:DNA primase small subunit